MRGRDKLLLAALAAALIAFGLGLARLLNLRLEVGDVYPPYSSHRTDPLGASALADALAEVGVDVQRNHKPLSRLPAGRGATLMVLGAAPRWLEGLSGDDANGLERFVTGGGRLVLTLLPGQSPGRLLAEKPETQPADLAERWGLAWSTHDKPPGPGDQAVPADTNAGPAAAVPWHGRVYFDRLSPRWKAPWLYRGKPAIVERPLGAGTVVAAADSYFASNEALRAHRRAGLLVWAVGPDRRAIFDETHLGVHDEPGIVMLARRYGLAWMLPALAVLAALFVWKNATSLVPRRPAGRDEQAVRVEGRDSSAGLVNLLRRAVPAGQLLRVCFERWSRRLPPERKDLAAKAARMARIVEREEKLPRRRRDPAAAYREMAKVLNERA